MPSIEPKPANLESWLSALETLHPKTIALGLDRVSQVAERMGLKPTFPVITVAGTNGKGSTCAMLESIYKASGYTVGCYTSPHILRYNERVRINQLEGSDAQLCRAFEAVELARKDVSLTYFEFGTLAAVWLFIQQQVDVAILEVGLGGRLDAVNIFDPSCTMVTSIGLDHTEFLGNSLEEIAFEKAGVFRHQIPAICGEPNPPLSLIHHANAIGADLFRINAEFGAQDDGGTWTFYAGESRLSGLPKPELAGDFQLLNAACVIFASITLQQKLPVSRASIISGLCDVQLRGRFEKIASSPEVILDVAHNPHAAKGLAQNLDSNRRPHCQTVAVFAMLADKDIEGVIVEVSPYVDVWFLADIHHLRGAKAKDLALLIARINPQAKVICHAQIEDAFQSARQYASENDRIIAFGSFYTVAEVLKQQMIEHSTH